MAYSGYQPLIDKENKGTELTKREYKEKKETKGTKTETKTGTLTLSDVIVLPKIEQDNLPIGLEQEFNRPLQGKSFVTLSGVRGQRIQPNTVMLVHENNIPELITFRPSNIALNIVGPTTKHAVLGVYKLTSIFYGSHGSYVVNVPFGKYAKVFSKNNPILLAAGCHVFHDPTFQFDPQKDLVDVASPYIKHGDIHILSVPSGFIAKVWFGTEPQFLDHQKMAYVFRDPNFILDSRGNNLFEPADNPSIIHGSAKRLMPCTGEVAVTYKTGKLEIIPPSKDGKPIYITDAQHQFKHFLKTNLLTLQFPTADEKNNDQSQASKYELFMTQDSCPVGIKLCVAFEISNPEKAITKFNTLANIIDHIEKVTKAEMVTIVQTSTIQQLFSPPRTVLAEVKSSSMTLASAPLLESCQETAFKDLRSTLEKDGITLSRFSIEEAKIMDDKLAKDLSKQTVMSADTAAQEAVIDAAAVLARKKAQQVAEVKKIEQDQINANTISAAQAELESSKLRAQGKLVLAEADNKARESAGKIYAENPQLLQLEMVRMMCEGLQRANLNLTTIDLANLFSAVINPPTVGTSQLGLFAQMGQRAPANQMPSMRASTIVANTETVEAKRETKSLAGLTG